MDVIQDVEQAIILFLTQAAVDVLSSGSFYF